LKNSVSRAARSVRLSPAGRSARLSAAPVWSVLRRECSKSDSATPRAPS